MSFQNKQTIFSRFNEAVKNLNSFSKTSNEGVEKLRNASGAIYQVFEWSLKHHLVNNKNVPNEKKNEILGEKDFGISDIMILLYKYGTPEVYSSEVSINWDVIYLFKDDNRDNSVHSGESPKFEPLKFIAREVKKVVLNYVDANAQLKELKNTAKEKIPEWDKFLEITKKFDSSEYNYILVTDSTQNIPFHQRRLVSKLPWDLVIDFDNGSKNNGLLASYPKNENGNVHEIKNVEANPISSSANVPYWFIARDVGDRRYKNWITKYDEKIRSLFKKFSRQYIAPTKVIIACNHIKNDFIDHICKELYIAFNEKVDLIFTVNKINEYSNSIVEKYDGKKVNLSFSNFANGIMRSNRLLDVRVSKNEGVYLPTKENKFKYINKEEFNSLNKYFEVIHKYIYRENDFNKDKIDELEKEFYKGELIPWCGFKANFDIEREKNAELKKAIELELRSNNNVIFRLVHKPGIGGTTISRRIAWELREEYPTVILKEYKRQHTADQIRKLYDLTRKTVFVIIEKHLMEENEIQQFYDEVKIDTRSAVFLVVERHREDTSLINNDSNNKIKYLGYLNNDELLYFTNKYISLLEEADIQNKQYRKNKLKKIKNYKHEDEKRCTPFYMGLITYEKEFKGLGNYINKFLDKIQSDEQRKIILYISLCYDYANMSIPADLFSEIINRSNIDDLSKKDSIKLEKYLPENSDSVFLYNKKNSITYWRPRHYLFANEIKKQLLSDNKNNNDNLWKQNLTQNCVELIKDSEALGNKFDYMKKLIKKMFIERDERNNKIEGGNNDYSDLMNDIITKEGKERIFQQLVNSYPEEPHFKAHLARHYSLKNKNFELALEYINKAISLSEAKGNEDALLYHMKGDCLRRQANNLMEEVSTEEIGEENIDSLKSYIREAAIQFEKVRELNNSSYGYIAHIQMLIKIVDFGYKISDLDRSEFLQKNVDTWYGKCLDEAVNLFENVKRRNLISEDNSYLQECDKELKIIYDDLGSILESWNNKLDQGNNNPYLKRLVVDAYLRKYDYNQINSHTLRTLIGYMEENIQLEPNNKQNIINWFDLARQASYISINRAIEKLTHWKTINDTVISNYYLYILKVLKALEGYSSAKEEAKRLIRKCKKMAKNLPNKTFCYEWYGNGKNLKKIISSKNINFRRNNLNNLTRELEFVEGEIEEYKHAGSGIINVEGLPVFFRPGQANEGKGFTIDDEGKKVYLWLGFSYDGLRAYNDSVHSIDYKPDFKTGENKMRIGDIVNCRVIGFANSNTHVYVKIKAYNKEGSIYIGELKEERIKNLREEVSIGDNIKAKVIEYNKKHGWQLSKKRV